MIFVDLGILAPKVDFRQNFATRTEKMRSAIENLLPTSFYNTYGLTKTLLRTAVAQLYIVSQFC